MSKNIDDVIREVMKSNKEIHNMDTHLTKDIVEVKKGIKDAPQLLNLMMQ